MSPAEKRVALSPAKKLVFYLVPYLGFACLVAIAELACRNLTASGSAWRAFVNYTDYGVPWDTPVEVSPTQLLMRDPILHHRWKPLVFSHGMFRGIDYHIRTNRQGWIESRDVTEAKPPGTIRIFMVGDSTTQGVCNSPDNMVDIVEIELNRRWNRRGVEVEVINTGTSSYSTVIYYLLIREKLLEYDPDIIVVNVDMTDVMNDSVYLQTAAYRPDGTLHAILPDPRLKDYRMSPRGLVRLSWYERLHARLKERSAIVYALSEMAPVPAPENIRVPRPESGSDADWLRHDWTSSVEQNVEISMGYLRDIQRLCRRHQVELVVTGVPHHPQYTGAWSARPHEVLRARSEEWGITFFDSHERLAPQIQGSEQAEYYWETDPTHFGPAGNAIWARAQLAVLDPLVGKRHARRR